MSSRSVDVRFPRAKGATALGVTAILLGVAGFAATPVSAEPGAVYTTDRSGANNQNTRYVSKSDVLLTAGAMKGGSRLADGAYYFEITDPSTKRVLSSDALAARRFEVSGGVVVAATHPLIDFSAGGVADHFVTLMPFANTTSHGGEYKLTVAHTVDCPAATNASLAICSHANKKTDTFKVDFDAVVATQVSATRIALGTTTSVTDAVTVTGTAAEGYPHGIVTVYLCSGTTCSATAAGARVVGTFETGKGKATKDVTIATGSVAVDVKDLAAGDYTFNAVYAPATQVAYNPATDPGTNETFVIYATAGPPAPPGGTTPTQGGAVAGVTSPPRVSLPPTDVTATSAGAPDRGGVAFLIVLLASLTVAGTLAPVRIGRRR